MTSNNSLKGVERMYANSDGRGNTQKSFLIIKIKFNLWAKNGANKIEEKKRKFMKNKFHKEISDWEHFVYISPFLAFSPSHIHIVLCVLSRHFFSALLPLHTRCTIWGHITHQKAARLCFIRASKKLLCCFQLKEGAEGRSDMVITFVHRENNVLAMRDEKKKVIFIFLCEIAVLLMLFDEKLEPNKQ